MNFSEQCSDFLRNNMLINVDELERDLGSKFGSDAHVFDELVYFILHDDLRYASPLLDASKQACEFKKFKDRCLGHITNCQLSEKVIDYLYVIICYFGSFYSGGLAALFKHRQAEHDGPRIYISSPLTERAILEQYLDEEIVAYRGMSVAEFESGLFGMSWSLSESKAKEFAFDYYRDKPRGVVVKAIILRDKVLYFSPEDREQEIVIGNQTISCGVIVQK